MTVGNRSIFAIESGITRAYERAGFKALGFFTIYLGGYRYGIYAPDATLLACSLGEVQSRIANRGKHNVSFAVEPEAGVIADAIRDAIYAPDQEDESFFNIQYSVFHDLISSSKIIWAPDGDEAFDDSSFVLQFDIEDQVRLIGFRCTAGYHHDPETLRDIWLKADEFYDILQRWYDDFEAEWEAAPKISCESDGAI